MTPLELQRVHVECMTRGVLPMWTIYNKPKDYPNGIIARMFEVRGKNDGPTDHTITGKIDELRRAFQAAGLVRIPREEADEPQIVECWI